MTWNWSTLAAVAYGISWVIFIGAHFVVTRKRNPSSAPPWLMLLSCSRTAGC